MRLFGYRSLVLRQAAKILDTSVFEVNEVWLREHGAWVGGCVVHGERYLRVDLPVDLPTNRVGYCGAAGWAKLQGLRRQVVELEVEVSDLWPGQNGEPVRFGAVQTWRYDGKLPKEMDTPPTVSNGGVLAQVRVGGVQFPVYWSRRYGPYVKMSEILASEAGRDWLGSLSVEGNSNAPKMVLAAIAAVAARVAHMEIPVLEERPQGEGCDTCLYGRIVRGGSVEMGDADSEAASLQLPDSRNFGVSTNWMYCLLQEDVPSDAEIDAAARRQAERRGETQPLPEVSCGYGCPLFVERRGLPRAAEIPVSVTATEACARVAGFDVVVRFQ